MNVTDPSPLGVRSTDPLTPGRARTIAVAALAAIVAAFAIVALVARPDGATRGDIWRFVGRLHPALIHLPIGLIVLVPVLELCGLPRRFSHLRASAGFVLWLATIGAIVGVALGYTLGRSDGNRGDTVTYHMVAGLVTAALCVAALALRPIASRLAHVSYAATLATLLGAVAIAGHLGGQLTYGEAYFSSVAPRWLAPLLGPVDGGPPAPPVAKPSPAPPGQPSTAPASMPSLDRAVTFAGDVMPMFAQSCVSCHGPAKVKAGLRLDTFAELMKGGDSGEAIVAGNAEQSDLYHRMTLPPDDDDAMPPKNAKHRPTPEQIAAVKKWIEGGAKDD